MDYQINNNKIIILNMLNLQDELNKITNGINYKNGTTLDGDTISWTRCIVMESFELANLTKWKHWDDIKGKENWDDINIKIIDIWHFILSFLIQHYNNESISQIILKYCNYNVNISQNPISMRDEAEELIYYALMIQNNQEIKIQDATNVILNNFFNICKFANISFNNLYKLYTAKNMLNLFRQNNGYKEGTYNKIWQGKKDSDIMYDILKEEIDNINQNKFYLNLLELYKA